ncbi:MAG: hypothetical protein A2W91_11530 [Bacteroidetes bacterium GWF2_38_335]|nr:MAG: hypothetical protein A2W91_11530 [Bacteroidetes bacterium GWF2_38_335]OFY77911.1 MAG: hypothetical protein A2281_18275 [Bacteroidetes bacterium RIFOXYA12_FULL_38_20]HBS86650.1 hypothetical protein [Bacteroidales bacterium]
MGFEYTNLQKNGYKIILRLYFFSIFLSSSYTIGIISTPDNSAFFSRNKIVSKNNSAIKIVYFFNYHCNLFFQNYLFEFS